MVMDGEGKRKQKQGAKSKRGRYMGMDGDEKRKLIDGKVDWIGCSNI